MKFNLYALIVFVGLMGKSYAQVKPSRLSFEVNGGVPIIFSKVMPGIATYGGLGLRYNLTAAISAQVAAEIGIMRGGRDVPHRGVPAEKAQEYMKYNNSFYQYTFRGQLNLERVFKLRSVLKKINPYLIGGVGYTGTMGIEAERFDGRVRKYDNIEFWTVQAGAMVRYYLNPVLDLNIGSELNLTETKYLDGVPLQGGYDHFLTTYVGINVKIGAKRRKQHIEWVEKRVKNKPQPKPEKDLEDRHSKPELVAQEPDPLYSDSIIVANPTSADSMAMGPLHDKSSESSENAYKDPVAGQNPKTILPGLNGPSSAEMAATMAKAAKRAAENEEIAGAPTAKAVAPVAKVKPSAMATARTGAGKGASGLASRNGKAASAKGNTSANTGVAANGKSNASQSKNGISRANGTASAIKGQTGLRMNGNASGNNGIAANGKNNNTPATNALARRSASGVTGATLLSNPPAPQPIVKIDAPVDPKAPTLNFIEGIQKPVSSYNVIVGAFRKSKNAYNFRNKMRKLGYQAAIFRSDIDSRILRVCIYSTNKKEIALKQLEKARAEVVQGAWIHVFTR